MPTHLDLPYHDDPHRQEPLGRRYGWATVLYLTLAGLTLLLFLLLW